jgi:hypothetical protein
MLKWLDYAWMPEERLAGQDIANLACAADLPGADHVDFGHCLLRLQEMTDQVRQFTDKMLPRFRRKRWDYGNSEGYFRALCLITALQRDLGVRYNPAKIPDDAQFDVADSFIFGILDGPGGTCATLPVVYAAIGRRLGYPIRLVCAFAGEANHQFARWDEPGGERFNIEATAQGLSCHSDDYYRTGRYATSPEIEKAGCFLQSMTPRQELASFFANRAFIWEENGNIRFAVDAWCWAAALHATNQCMVASLKGRLNMWRRELERRQPSRFPKILHKVVRRRYPESLPFELEHDAICKEAIENLLNEPEFEQKLWGRIRRGEQLNDFPTKALVDSAPNVCDISFQFS